MTKVLIDQQLLQQAVTYMTSRPFSEVADIVLAIQQDAKVYEQPDNAPKLVNTPMVSPKDYMAARKKLKQIDGETDGK